MTKTDAYIHEICVAAILRKTMRPYNFYYTRYWKTKKEFIKYCEGINVEFENEEIPICSTIIDMKNWSIITTRRLITSTESIIYQGRFSDAINSDIGDFKGIEGNEIATGTVEFKNGNKIQCYIETKRASMVMVYGLQTRIQIE